MAKREYLLKQCSQIFNIFRLFSTPKHLFFQRYFVYHQNMHSYYYFYDYSTKLIKYSKIFSFKCQYNLVNYILILIMIKLPIKTSSSLAHQWIATANFMLSTYSKNVQMAFWARCFIRKITYPQDSKIKMADLQKELLNTSADEVFADHTDKMTEEQRKEFEAFKKEAEINVKSLFDINLNSKQPTCYKPYYNQDRVIKTINDSNRLVFFPTYVTSEVFKIIKSNLGKILFAGLRGTGKTFSFMLHNQLNLICFLAFAELLKQNKVEFYKKQFQQIVFKTFYWTIQIDHQIQNKFAIIEKIVKNILEQCPQIRKQIDQTVQQIFITLQNKKSIKKVYSCLYKLLTNIKEIYYEKFNKRTLLVIDQINVIAAQYRDFQEHLRQNPNLEYQDFPKELKKPYQNAKFYDKIRLKLEKIADNIILNSSINIQRQIVPAGIKRAMRQVPTQIVFGSKHQSYTFEEMNFNQIMLQSKEDYAKTMSNFIEFQLSYIYYKSGLKQQKTKVTQLTAQFQKLLQQQGVLNSAQLLQLRIFIESFKKKKLTEISAQNLAEIFESQKTKYFTDILLNYLRKIDLYISSQQTEKQLEQIIASPVKKLGSIAKINFQIFRATDKYIILVQIFNSIEEEKKHQAVNLDISWFFRGTEQRNLSNLDQVYDKEIFYTQKDTSSGRVFLKSYIPAKYFSYALARYMKESNKQNNKLKKLMKLRLNEKKNNVEIGYELERNLQNALAIQAKQIQINLKGEKQETITYKFENLCQMFQEYKNTDKNLQRLLKFKNKQFEQSLVCLPVNIKPGEQQKMSEVQKLDYILNHIGSQSQAADFLIVTSQKLNIDKLYKYDFFDITIQRNSEKKATNFLKFLWQMEQMRLKDYFKGSIISMRYFILGIYKDQEINIVQKAEEFGKRDMQTQNQNKTANKFYINFRKERFDIFIQNLKHLDLKCYEINGPTNMLIKDNKQNISIFYQNYLREAADFKSQNDLEK